MPRRKPRQTEEYEILLLKVLGFHASVSGAINPQVRDRRYALDRMKVHDFHSSLDLQAICTFPENRADANYFLNLHGTNPSGRNFSMTLGDCRIRDEGGSVVYRKVRGESRPTYEIPEG